MAHFKIVNTDNFGGDYPDEYFVNLPPMTVKRHRISQTRLTAIIAAVTMHPLLQGGPF